MTLAKANQYIDLRGRAEKSVLEEIKKLLIRCHRIGMTIDAEPQTQGNDILHVIKVGVFPESKDSPRWHDVVFGFNFPAEACSVGNAPQLIAKLRMEYSHRRAALAYHAQVTEDATGAAPPDELVPVAFVDKDGVTHSLEEETPS